MKTWRLNCGADAVLLENDVLKMWRDGGATTTLSAEQMPQSGHTETAMLRDIDLAATIKCVKPGRLPKRHLTPGSK